MTTKHSPVQALRRQADKIANMLVLTAYHGPVNDPTGKIAASLLKGEVVVGIVMDDKLIHLTIPWNTVRESTHEALVEYLLALMREEQLTS